LQSRPGFPAEDFLIHLPVPPGGPRRPGPSEISDDRQLAEAPTTATGGPQTYSLTSMSSYDGNGLIQTSVIVCLPTRGPMPIRARRSITGANITRSIVMC